MSQEMAAFCHLFTQPHLYHHSEAVILNTADLEDAVFFALILSQGPGIIKGETTTAAVNQWIG